MKLTAKDLLNQGVIDEIISEPLGGAHRDSEAIAMDVKSSIKNNLNFFESMSKDEIFDHRKNKFLKIGRDNGFNQSSKLEYLLYKEPSFAKIKKTLLKIKQFIWFQLSFC